MLKIKSKVDVITNSSSEVFLIKTDQSKKELLKDLLDFSDDSSSGMGGIVEVKERCNGYLSAEIDWSKKDLIDFLFGYFEVVDVEEGYIDRNKDGRVIGFSDIRDKEHEGGELLDILKDYEFYKDLDEKKITDAYLMMPKYEKKKVVNLSAFIYETQERRKKAIEEYNKRFGR